MLPSRRILPAVATCLAIATCAAAQSSGSAAELDVIKAELENVKRLIPDQAHIMADVDYHFANLWFAGRASNWALAEFYVNETRSHLEWAVRGRPVRRLSSGADFDLRPVLQGIEKSGLSELKKAIAAHDAKAFESSYRQTMSQCHGCHTAAEKPYLLPRIPLAPASRMIDLER